MDDLDELLNTPNCKQCLVRMQAVVGGAVGWQCPECGLFEEN